MSQKQPNADPLYDVSIVSFFDIFGFKALLEERRAEEILAIYQSLRTGPFRPDLKNDAELERRFLNFSDTFVRSTHLLSKANREAPDGLFFHELTDLLWMQFDLIQRHGVFLRGSITIENLYHKGDTVFGPALNRAYELENEVAVYPRIIIDPAVFSVYQQTPLLKAYHHTHDQDKQYSKSMLRLGDDGIWFIDYLKAIGRELTGEEPGYGAFLKKHRELVIENAKKFGGLNRIAAKYNWLANYHNTVIGELSDSLLAANAQRRKDLLIDSTDVQTICNL